MDPIGPRNGSKILLMLTLPSLVMSFGHLVPSSIFLPAETLTFLRDLTFTVPAGTLTVIFGATGAGKSGLLLALIGACLHNQGRRGGCEGKKRESVPQGDGVRVMESIPFTSSVEVKRMGCLSTSDGKGRKQGAG